MQFIPALKAQHNGSIAALLSYTQQHLAPPDLLVQGSLYQQPISKAQGTPYLYTDSFTNGSIFIKDYIFNNVPLLIDLEQNQIVMQQIVDGKTLNILLSSQSFDSIHVFNSTHLPNRMGLFFPQLIYNGQMQLYFEYDKDFIATYNDLTPNGSYSKLIKKYFVVKNQQLIPIKNKHSIIKLSQNQKETRTFLKNNKFKFKKADNRELRFIMKHLDYDN
ncbi:MAG: hypothetical protein ACPGLV_17380 [Bacteroidia bacterium]